MPWNTAQAKQRFPEIVKQTAAEPRLIYNRGRLVAAVIDADEFSAFQTWRQHHGAKTVGEAFAELRVVLQECWLRVYLHHRIFYSTH